jgi:soluble lytic murein transglycosylase-like protein
VTVDELRREKQRAQIVRYILTVNPKAPAWAIAPAVLKAADATGIDPSWLLAKLKQESYFNPFAVSSTGCRGLAQICRAAAADMGLPWDSAFDIDQNVRAGAEYLKRQLAATGGSMDAALTRYNGGDDPLFVEKIRRHRAAILRAMA